MFLLENGLPSDDLFSQESHETMCGNQISLSTPTDDDDCKCVIIMHACLTIFLLRSFILYIADIQPPTPKQGRFTQQ